MLEVVNETDEGRFVCINLEEFDDLVNTDRHETWTTLLDGQFQSNNRLLLATTNYIQRIPQRLLRPGRFSSLKEIPLLNKESRFLYLKSKGVSGNLLGELVDKTEEFTVDDLKEVVQNVIILGEQCDVVIEDIRKAKNLGRQSEEL
jgi:SpoVK/Ycf46/Vps4 family AAA+-type ATPase